MWACSKFCVFQMARKNEWPLDRMCLQCDVTKKQREDMGGGAPREGAYVCGLFMEGARWDVQSGVIAEARLKDLAPSLPVIFIRAIPVDRQVCSTINICQVSRKIQFHDMREGVACLVTIISIFSRQLLTRLNSRSKKVYLSTVTDRVLTTTLFPFLYH